MGRDAEILVVGLGRFGAAVAETLVDRDHTVLGVDSDPDLVQRYADRLTHVVQADSTDTTALRQIGAGDFDRAIVAIGTDIEASILTTAALVDLGVGDVWAKAITGQHGEILQRVGAHHVVFPERDMGERVAHRMAGSLDYFELDDSFALAETRPPRDIHGKSLGEAGVRSRYGVTVVCVKPHGGRFTHATAETVVHRDDILCVAGDTARVEAFSERG